MEHRGHKEGKEHRAVLGQANAMRREVHGSHEPFMHGLVPFPPVLIHGCGVPPVLDGQRGGGGGGVP